MEKTQTNASDDSVQEIAVYDRNPIGSEPVNQPAAEVILDRDAQTQEQPVDQQPEATSSLLTDKQEASAAPAKIQTGMVAVARLRPYAKNAEIYREREDALLLESIRAHGVRNDLLVDDDGVVYGGTTRLRYAEQAGLAEVPVKVISFKTEDEKVLRLLDDNLYRKKTPEEETREYMVRKTIEERDAARRRAEAGKKHGTANEEVKTVPPAPGKAGKARELASAGLGRSGVSMEKGCKVVLAADKVRKEGDPKTADELLSKLNKDGYTPALKYAESLDLVPKPKPKGSGIGTQSKAKGGATVQTAEPAPKVQSPTNDKGDAVGTPAPSSAVDNTTDDGGETREDEPQPVIRIIKTCDQLADDLDELTVADLTADQKGNLYRVLERVANWLAHHDEVLQVPARK